MATSVTIQCDPDYQTWVELQAEFVSASRANNGDITVSTKWKITGYAYSTTGKVNGDQVYSKTFSTGQPDTISVDWTTKSISGGNSWAAKSGSISVDIWGQNRRNTSGDPSSGQTDSDSGSFTWSIGAYTKSVTFNNNDGTGTTTSKVQTHGSAWNFPTTPTRQGYQFLGWFTAASGGNQKSGTYDASTDRSINTLYAHWEPLSILHVKSGSTITTYTNIWYKSGSTTKRIIGVYAVVDGVPKQGI